MTDGLRRAIRTGFCRPGDRLPSVRELVAHFDVSNRVPVAAIKKLREEGLVEAAPRNGCVVRHVRMPHWKGHVICIVPSGEFSYGIMMMVEGAEGGLCIEFDPFMPDEMVADGILAWFRREVRPSVVAIPVHWKEEKTHVS